jgi:hypothetical protein
MHAWLVTAAAMQALNLSSNQSDLNIHDIRTGGIGRQQIPCRFEEGIGIVSIQIIPRVKPFCRCPGLCFAVHDGPCRIVKA